MYSYTDSYPRSQFTQPMNLAQSYQPYQAPYVHSHSHAQSKLTTSLWEDEGTVCYQVDARGVCVARRQDNDMINGTKLLNVTGMSRGKRDGILKNEKGRVVVKVGAMHFKGVWIPFARAKALAAQFDISDILHPLFADDPLRYFYPPHMHPMNFGMSPCRQPTTISDKEPATPIHPYQLTKPTLLSTLPPVPSVPSMITSQTMSQPHQPLYGYAPAPSTQSLSQGYYHTDIRPMHDSSPPSSHHSLDNGSPQHTRGQSPLSSHATVSNSGSHQPPIPQEPQHLFSPYPLPTPSSGNQHSPFQKMAKFSPCVSSMSVVSSPVTPPEQSISYSHDTLDAYRPCQFTYRYDQQPPTTKYMPLSSHRPNNMMLENLVDVQPCVRSSPEPTPIPTSLHLSPW